MIALLWLMVVVVALVGGGVGFENVFLPSLAIMLLAAFAHLTGIGRFRRELGTFLLVLTILTLLHAYNGWGGTHTDAIGDGRLWLEAGQEIVAGGFLSTPIESIRGHVSHIGTAYLYAAVLVLGMGNLYSLMVLHALIIVLSATMIYEIAERLFDVRTAQLAYWMIALQPEVLAWSSVLIRESLVVLLISSFFYVCIRVFIDGSQQHVFYLLAIVGATYFVRASMVFGFIAIAFAWGAMEVLKHRRYVIAVVAVAAVVAIGIGLTMLHYTGDPRVQNVGTILVSGVEGRLIGTIEFSQISITRDFLGEKLTVMNFYLWPLWVIAYWIYPFPNLFAGIYNANPMLTVVEHTMGAVNFALLPFVLIGVLSIIQKCRPNRLMLIAAAAIMATGMTLACPCIVGRYRLIVTPFFILICGYAIAHIRMSQRVLVVGLIPLTMMAFYVSYLLVKVLLS
jgi:hypothetical protein